MRRHLTFTSEDCTLAATLDEGRGSTGLLIVSGGNEIRSGAHGGHAWLAARIAADGYPVFRYDPPGVGESEGENDGFSARGASLCDAIAAFRAAVPGLSRLVAFGNCDAATQLLLNDDLAVDRLLLANPWAIEANGAEDGPPPAAIRARYASRLADPIRLLRDIAGGRLSFGKAWRGVRRAMTRPDAGSLAQTLSAALTGTMVPKDILLATRDATAIGFSSAVGPTDNTTVRVHRIDSPSHSFADDKARQWLLDRILEALRCEDRMVTEARGHQSL